MVGAIYMNFEGLKQSGDLNLRKKRWKLEKSLYEDLERARNVFIDTAYNVFQGRCIPDRYRLSEKQIIAFLEDAATQDAGIRYKRLSLKKADFQAYPPFWYVLGKTAHELKRDLEALAHFGTFDAIHEGILRNDPFAVGVSMTRAAILLEGGSGDAEWKAIEADLKRIIKNSWDTDWASYLFCSLVYAQSGRYQEAYNTLERNKIYFSKLPKNAERMTLDAELSIAAKEMDVSRILSILENTANRRVYDYLYMLSVAPQIKGINELILADGFILEHALYQGVNAKWWLSTVFSVYFPQNWVSDQFLTELHFNGNVYPCESIQPSKTDRQSKAEFIIKKMPNVEPPVTLVFKDGKMQVVLEFEPVFRVKPDGKKAFSHYFMREVSFGNQSYRFDREKRVLVPNRLPEDKKLNNEGELNE